MFQRLRNAVLVLALCGAASPAVAYDSKPWIEDARQIRAALGSRYPNIDWLTVDRGVDLDAAFKAVEGGLEKARSDAEAKALLDRALASLADGHVQVDWSPVVAAPAATGPSVAAPPCADIRPQRQRPPVASGLPGWTPLDTGEGAREFPGGIVTVDGRKVGVVQIVLFMADRTVCEAAAAELKHPLDKPCDDDCSRRLDQHMYQLMSDRFAARLEAMKAVGAQVLVVDLAGNGGGREWAEVAVRQLSPLRLKSAPVRFARSPLAAESLESLAQDIEANIGGEKGATKAALLREAADLRARATEARRVCDPGADAACPLLIDAGYGSGVRASGDPVALADKAWGHSVFQPAKWSWREGVWSGPLIVLVDGKSASASEEFAAIIQDNKAGVILGAPTLGAGCGHATGLGPVVLKNSGGRLSLPDCLRLRADGSNEIGGVEPDVLVGFRGTDGPALKTRRLAPRLPEAVARAVALAGSRGR
ncbi:S41 family peptidase [uncultured Caulobacter sp.]|mgnify:CR=1 FL=1|uniref:S41 family peptidase n=1 Tax=uncultured Caulobacter sp. TaxID=158749 RepID=UPI00262C9AAE|nr:S41 family peptidase [uncultured Caulobacter sp.]